VAADGYVYDADAACLSGGCMIGGARSLLNQARQVIEQTSRSSMSAALWCDQGGHAFSERDPGRQRIRVNVLDDNEQETEVAKDFCGDCAAKAGLTQPRKTRPTITTGTVTGG
jgi:hypothetical protein